MTITEQAKAYQDFFYRSDAGKALMLHLQSEEKRYITTAQRENDLDALSRSAGLAEVLQHIDTVIAQAVSPAQ